MMTSLRLSKVLSKETKSKAYMRKGRGFFVQNISRILQYGVRQNPSFDGQHPEVIAVSVQELHNSITPEMAKKTILDAAKMTFGAPNYKVHQAVFSE